MDNYCSVEIRRFDHLDLSRQDLFKKQARELITFLSLIGFADEINYIEPSFTYSETTVVYIRFRSCDAKDFENAIKSIYPKTIFQVADLEQSLFIDLDGEFNEKKKTT